MVFQIFLFFLEKFGKNRVQKTTQTLHAAAWVISLDSVVMRCRLLPLVRQITEGLEYMVTQNFTVLVRIQFLHCRFLSSIEYKRDGNEIAVIHYSEMIAWYKKTLTQT